MSDDTESSADDVAADTAVGADDAARRPSPRAQAASRARRIGGRPAPGPRPKPAVRSPDTDVPADTAGPATPVKSEPDAVAESTRSAHRGGMRAARAAATERAAETAQPAPTPDERSTRKPGRVVEHDGEPDVQALRRRPDRLRWIPAGVLGAAVVVLAVLGIVFGHGVWWGTKSVAEVRGEVLSATKTCTAKILSYDYRHLAESKKAGAACTTGKFKSQYIKSMDTIVAKLAPQTRTIQSLQVENAAIEQVSSDGNQWTLIVYGQNNVSSVNTQPGIPRLDVLSVRVAIDKVGGKWLISNLTLIG